METVEAYDCNHCNVIFCEIRRILREKTPKALNQIYQDLQIIQKLVQQRKVSYTLALDYISVFLENNNKLPDDHQDDPIVFEPIPTEHIEDAADFELLDFELLDFDAKEYSIVNNYNIDWETEGYPLMQDTKEENVPKEPKEDVSKDLPSCSIIDYEFVQILYVKGHQEMHEFPESWMCEICGCFFRCKANLSSHQQMCHKINI